MADTEVLRGNIAAIESAGGLKAASQMADTMVDPFERLQRVVENVAITWGSFLLPLITPYVEKLADAGKAVRAWAGRFPHLTRLIGLATVGVFGFILAVAALKIAVGLMLLRAAVPVAVWVASTAAMLAWRGALLALQGVLLLAKVAVWAFNGALWLNPITWIVAAIVALIAVIALSVVYWDELKAAAGAAADRLLERWRAVQAWFAGFARGWVALFRGAVEQVAGFFACLLGADSLVGRLAGLAGLNFEGAGTAPAAGLARRGAGDLQRGQRRQQLAAAGHRNGERDVVETAGRPRANPTAPARGRWVGGATRPSEGCRPAWRCGAGSPASRPIRPRGPSALPRAPGSGARGCGRGVAPAGGRLPPCGR
jgi:hypothetical protein